MIITQKYFAETQHTENVFVYETEKDKDEENGNCIPFSVGCNSVSKIYNSMSLRNLTSDEIGKQKKDVFGEERENSNDKMLTYINKKWKGDPKV